MPVDINCLTCVIQVLNTAFTQNVISDLQCCIYVPIVFCCVEMINSLMQVLLFMTTY
jgi:hypothetical protein